MEMLEAHGREAQTLLTEGSAWMQLVSLLLHSCIDSENASVGCIYAAHHGKSPVGPV